MAKQFDYDGAKQAGYSDEEILQHLAQSKPNFDVQGALQSGYSPEEINSHLTQAPKRSVMQKGARIAGQFGLGAAEQTLLPYELATAPLASKEAQHGEYRQRVFEDIERLQEQKAAGQWDQQDQALYDSLVEQIQKPEKAEKFVKTADIGIRRLAEKATGLDLHPEGVLEKAANWAGFIKKPSSIKELVKLGTNPKEITKAIMPGKTALRGLTAGTAMQLAEEGNFGPIGTLAATIVGDVIGAGLPGAAKAVAQPKKTAAKLFASISNSKDSIVKDLTEASEGKEFTKDIGTLTNNNIVKMIQARLAASGFTGKPLEDLRKQMTREIVDEYESIAKSLGEARFETLHEAGEIGKEALTDIRNAEKSRIGELYTKSNAALKEGAAVNPVKLASTIRELESSLAPGAVKSTEQKAVLDVLEKLKSDIYSSEGQVKPADVKALMNTKAALNDIINYEVQGGQKQLLKHLNGEIDKLITAHGAINKEFGKHYAQANKEFKKHAELFRNENIDKILTSRDPMTLINKMNSVHGIQDLKKALMISPEGKQIFDSLARKKLDMIFNKGLYEGAKEQLALGTFSNVLEKGKNRELVKELLSPEAYKRLINLQKHTGKLAETAQKFLNASQSATAYADLQMGATLLGGLFGLFTGNPFGLSALAAFGGANILSRLIANPEFLKLTEEAIIAAEKNQAGKMSSISKEMGKYVKSITPESMTQ